MEIVKNTSKELKIHHIPIVAQQRRQTGLGGKLALPTMDGIVFEKIVDIVSLEAKGNYTNVHFIDGRKVLICKTLQHVENKILHTGQFVRIHRSFTVNLERIQKYFKGKGGYVKMENGNTINVSVGKKQYFMEALKQYFC